MARAKTVKTKVASKTTKPNGDRVYGPYDKKNNAGKPTDRKINIVVPAKGKPTSEHAAKTELNKKRVASGKKPIPKQKPGKGIQVAHNPGTSRASTTGTTAQSAKQNIGAGNKARR